MLSQDKMKQIYHISALQVQILHVCRPLFLDNSRKLRKHLLALPYLSLSVRLSAGINAAPAG